MKNLLIILVAILFTNLTASGQNLFLIGDKSYPCTNAITLESNSNDRANDGSDDLLVYIARNGNSGLFGVSTKSFFGSEFTGKLYIYLEDGTVLTCNQSAYNEQVDDRALALYSLTNDQLDKLKQSNIHTVKYTMHLLSVQKYSASNKGVATHEIISELFNPKEKLIINDKTEDNTDWPPVLEDPVKEKPFTYVEQMPRFPDGQEAMYKYIYGEIKYPDEAKANGVEGQVIIQFIVSSEGEIQNAKVIRGIGGGCNEEALRVVNSMPDWIPARHNGKNVAVYFTLPIKFVLPE